MSKKTNQWLQQFLKEKKEQKNDNILNSNNSNILAPMVRISSLPFRLLAIKYGCNIVYSPEINDTTLLNSNRIINNKCNTIDYTKKTNNEIVFRTYKNEPIILQIGSNNANNCLKIVNIY